MGTQDPGKLKKAIVPLDGLHCSACTARVEKGLREMKGMAGVSVNLSTRTAFLLYDPSLIDAAAVIAKVESLGYKALSFSQSAGAAGSAALGALEREKDVLFYRFLLGLLLTGFMLLDYAAGFSAYTMMTAAGLAWWFAGRHFHAGFGRALKTRAADMDTLVSLSTSVMFFYGVFVTLYPPVGGGGGYRPRWHEVGMLITFINLGRWLETRSRGRAGEAVSKLFRIAPKFARRLCPSGEETVPVTEIVCGDKILLRPGEQIPADGKVTNGASLVDESLLTGEAVPREKAEGSSLYAGTVNETGWLEFRAEGVGEETALMRICRAVQESQAAKSSVQRLVDRISAWFVPLVFLAACFSAALWFYYSSPYKAVNVFAAVLAVACPCAMGLAVPIAVAVGFGRAASEGILMRNVDILERVRRVDVIIFDKTGTITNGRLRLEAVKPFMSGENEFLGLLAAAEDKSEHPFAAAVRAAAAAAGVKPGAVIAFEAFPGKGVKARVEKGEITAGSLRWFAELGLAVPEEVRKEVMDAADAVLLLALEGEFKGYARLGDTLRPEAADIVRELTGMGIEPVMASGDRRVVVAAAAEAVGIKTFHAEIFPEDKKELVRSYKALGKMTAMVGDGFNDAPALAEADIGISMRSGTDVAAEASDMTLMRNDLKAVVNAVKLSKAIKRTINQNLAWAFVYNMALIPFAAGAFYPLWGIMIPAHFAGAAMALSSFSVVLNSLRLKKMKV